MRQECCLICIVGGNECVLKSIAHVGLAGIVHRIRRRSDVEESVIDRQQFNDKQHAWQHAMVCSCRALCFLCGKC